MIIPEHNYTAREQTVVDILRPRNDIKTFLNVGFKNWADPRNQWWINICKANNIEWGILEIFEPNVQQAIADGCPRAKIITGSILDQSMYGEHDCIMHWHGPEHIAKRTYSDALSDIESKANKLLILGMPHGEEKQGAVYGNQWEEHISAWDERDFEPLGYSCVRVNDRVPGHMTAYKEF